MVGGSSGEAAPTQVLSVRLPADVVERLRLTARQAGDSTSGLAQRHIDEGLRMDAHPGIMFRAGPTGRRAALLRGPDVWEVIALIRSLPERGEDAVHEAAEWLALSDEQVRAALGYYGDYPDEIDERIALNEETAERARAAWEKQQQVLA